MLLEFFRWWYGSGWIKAYKAGIRQTSNVQKAFSIPVLVTTLFAPWKRIVSPKGQSLDEKMRSLLDNLTSRAVGFFVRLGALIASAFLTFLTLTAGLALASAWPLLPLLAAYLILRSLVG